MDRCWAIFLLAILQCTICNTATSISSDGTKSKETSPDLWDELPPFLKKVRRDYKHDYGKLSAGITAMGVILKENRILKKTIFNKLFLEGDIYLGPQRNAVVNTRLLWPNAVVPYEIHSSFADSSRTVIMEAIGEFHKHTCLRFVPRTTETDYLHVYPGTGCWSYVGKFGGKQPVSLGPGCANHKSTPMHEFMHAVGFQHEQSRTDRDNYVSILWNNIQSGKAGQFEKYQTDYIQDLGSSYDYYSIMHYYSKAFSKDGKYTILPKQDGVSSSDLGSSKTFTPTDKYKLNALYKCETDDGDDEDDDDDDGSEGGDGNKWRDDLRCGPSYPLSNGNPAECDPNGIYPCCAPSGWCGNSVDHCQCSKCTDYSGTDDEDEDDDEDDNGDGGDDEDDGDDNDGNDGDDGDDGDDNGDGEDENGDGNDGDDGDGEDENGDGNDGDGEDDNGDGGDDGDNDGDGSGDEDDDNDGSEGEDGNRWREDLRCGPSYPLSNGIAAECDPNGIYPCCAPSGWCGNTVNHCKCSECTDYTGTDDGDDDDADDNDEDDDNDGEGGDGNKWRDDLRCGPSYPLPNGSPAECDPNGIYPCCAPSGWCGNTIHHCGCYSCTDYSGTDDGGDDDDEDDGDDGEEGGGNKWRDDLRCGESYPLSNGNPAECDPNGIYSCCAPSGWCGNTIHHCACSGCTDYSGTDGGDNDDDDDDGDNDDKTWRDELRCGASYPLPNGSPAECDPNGIYPCCAPSGWCGNTHDHCACYTCTDYRTDDGDDDDDEDEDEDNGGDGSEGKEGKTWRDDLRCGPSYPLSNGSPAECNPNGIYPCCAPSGWCGNTVHHCACSSCTDYTGNDGGDDINSGSIKTWRDDLRCGPSYPLSNGRSAECDPSGIYPCCAPSGWCGNTVHHCACSSCTDYTGNDGDDINSGSIKTWRGDLRCGPSYPLSNGRPAECNPNGIYPCCAPSGWCGNTHDHCACYLCTDYSGR